VIAELAVAAALAASPTVLDGVPVHLRPGTEQVVTVNHTDGYRARVTFWKLTEAGTKREQGTGTTPLGSYGLPSAFGMEPAEAGWKLRYRQVESGDFWVQDNESAFYNRYRNRAEGGFRWWLPTSDPDSSERLTDFRHQYRIAVVTDFNQAQVRHRGAGIFLHVNGAGATSGCVSAPGVFMDKLMRRLDPARVPVIAVGR
jgi:L,D-peptidoglycan transpeptidase YkuD (ErfK/YbiS/YcfS/YnhG family)